MQFPFENNPISLSSHLQGAGVTADSAKALMCECYAASFSPGLDGAQETEGDTTSIPVFSSTLCSQSWKSQCYQAAWQQCCPPGQVPLECVAPHTCVDSSSAGSTCCAATTILASVKLFSNILCFMGATLQ